MRRSGGPRAAAVWWSIAGFAAVCAYAVVGVFHIYVWNPLAAVPGAPLEQIRQRVAAQTEADLASPLVLGWGLFGALAAATVVVATLRGAVLSARTAANWQLGLLALGAPAFYIASAGSAVALADTYAISGADHAPAGPALYAVSAAAGLVLLVQPIRAWAQRRRDAPEPLPPLSWEEQSGTAGNGAGIPPRPDWPTAAGSPAAPAAARRVRRRPAPAAGRTAAGGAGGTEPVEAVDAVTAPLPVLPADGAETTPALTGTGSEQSPGPDPGTAPGLPVDPLTGAAAGPAGSAAAPAGFAVELPYPTPAPIPIPAPAPASNFPETPALRPGTPTIPVLEEAAMSFIPTPPPVNVPAPAPFAAPGQRPGVPGTPAGTLANSQRTIRSAYSVRGEAPAQQARQVNLLRDDPAKPDVISLLAQNRELLYPGLGAGAAGLTPPYLKDPSVTFWTVRENGTLLGCGAVKEFRPAPGNGINEFCGEITSMRTAAHARGLGVAQVILQQIISDARARGYASLLLETGTQEFFASSRRLYQRHGFVVCPPFGKYRADPGSIFMRLDLQPKDTAPASDAAAAEAAAGTAGGAAPASDKTHAKAGTLTAILAAQRAMAPRPPGR